MSFVNKLMESLKLGEDYEDEYEDEYYDDDEDDVEEEYNSRFSRKYRDEEEDEAPKKAKLTPMRSTKRSTISPGMEVCVVKPTSIEDARDITDTLLANRTVVLNLEGLDVDLAQRIIDFTSGSTYAIRGNLQKISNYIFIIF